MKKIIAIAAIAAASITTAHAEESNFAGAKIGVVGGYDEYEMSILTESIGKKSGFVYGVTAGYDIQSGNAIVGAEVEFSDPETKIGLGDGDDDNAPYIRADRQLYAGLRVGGEVLPSLLLYGKGGYVNSKFGIVLDSDDGAKVMFTDKMEGYRLGAGAEYLRGNAFGRLEYRFTDLGKYRDILDNGGLNVQRHQVVLAAGLRF